MARAEAGDLERYGDQALAVIRQRAAAGLETAASDVRAEIGTPPGPGILGAAFKRAAADGLIRHLRFQRSRLRSRHGGTESVWGPGW